VVARKWVLIADDDQTLRGVFKEALERQGYATLTCADGYEAFEVARTVMPHLIILDLHMERASDSSWTISADPTTRFCGRFRC
jgi:CheY-like chemotaxis protein